MWIGGAHNSTCYRCLTTLLSEFLPQIQFICFLLYLSPFFKKLIWERERERDEGRKREKEREGENKHWYFVPFIYAFIGWFFVCALTGNWTHNLGVLGQCSNQMSNLARARLLFFFNFIYIFLEREEEREKERERNINVWLPLTHPLLGTWPATQAVPWLGIETATLWFTG